MEVKNRAKIITDWINNYCETTSFNPKALVVGISGGIDSSVVSTLCANTGRRYPRTDYQRKLGKWYVRNIAGCHNAC